MLIGYGDNNTGTVLATAIPAKLARQREIIVA